MWTTATSCSASKRPTSAHCELSLPFFFVYELIYPLGESSAPEDKIPHIAHYTIDTIPYGTVVTDFTANRITVSGKK